MLYVVLGMHKSGTTAISEMLDKSGICMGTFDPFVSYDAGNKYERHEVQRINEKLLGRQNAHSLETAQLFPAVEYSEFVKDINDLVTLASAESGDWGFKDPRTSLTYQIWARYLPEHRVVAVFRNPVSVLAHYQRHVPYWKLVSRFLIALRAVSTWYIYNSNILAHYRTSAAPFLILDFDELMQRDGGLSALKIFTRRSIADHRSPAQLRSRDRKTLRFVVLELILLWMTGKNIHKLHNCLREEAKECMASLLRQPY